MLFRSRELYHEPDNSHPMFYLPINKNAPFIISTIIEHKLALHLAKFTDTIYNVALECYPHYLCQYLYNLAGLLMQFYEECSVINAESELIKQSRLNILRLTANTLKIGLLLLGIEVVEKM